jgi:hypothetical protein
MRAMKTNLVHEVVACYPLDALNDGYVPPGKAGELVRWLKIDQGERESVCVEQLATGGFFLRWEEPPEEKPGENECLSFIDREEPLTREEAFGLVAAVYMPEGFQSEIDAL